MANPYNLNLLGGLDLGQTIRGVAQDVRNIQEQDRLRNERQRMQDLTQMAAGGDSTAIEELFSINPNLAAAMEERNQQRIAAQGAEQAELSKQAEIDWGLRWRQAATEEEREALKQEALANPLIDFDESDLAVGGNQANLAVNTMLFQNLGREAYKQFFETETGEKGTFTVKETPTGFIKLNTATGQVSTIKDNAKEVAAAKKREKEEFDQQLKEADTNFQRSKDIRNRYDKKTGDFTKVRDAFARIEASTADPSPAGDLSLIFNYMKMLDPGSTVREGEFATAAGAASVPEQFKGAYQRVISGKKLTDSQRKDFMNRADKLMKKAENQQVKDRQEAIDLGNQWGVTELDIFGQAQAQPQQTQVGRFQVRVK